MLRYASLKLIMEIQMKKISSTAEALKPGFRYRLQFTSVAKFTML